MLLATRLRAPRLALIACQDLVCSNTSMFHGMLQDRLNVGFACCVCILMWSFQSLTSQTSTSALS